MQYSEEKLKAIKAKLTDNMVLLNCIDSKYVNIEFKDCGHICRMRIDRIADKCNNKECYSKRQSKLMKEKSNTTEHRKLMSKIIKTFYAGETPAEKLKRIEKQTIINRQIAADPISNAKLRNSILKLWTDESYRQKRIDNYKNNKIKDNSMRKYLYDEKTLINFIESLETKPTMLELALLLNLPYTTVVQSLSDNIRKNYITDLSHHNSTFQKSVIAYIEDLIGKPLVDKINLNNKQIIKPLELDIYLPEYNVAIECNGVYYHSIDMKDKNYHYNKYKLCNEKGIRLIQIWDYEWYNSRQQPILKNIIKHALGLIENKIYARDCKIKEINGYTQEIKDFVNANNIAGHRNYKDAIGLYYNDILVEVFTIGHAYFGKGKYDIEIIRGASKLDTVVVGGSSKLWKYITEVYMINNNLDTCVYYVDNNYFNSSSQAHLKDLNYITHNISFKNYFRKTGEVKNRSPQKYSEMKLLEDTNEIISFYNAGSDVFVYTKRT